MIEKNKNNIMKSEYTEGFRDGIPIALAYFSVSFTFGIMCMSMGLSVFEAVIISLTNLTSAGQFAAIPLIVYGKSYIELIITQFVINIRYALMSLSLSQKLDKSVKRKDRFIMAFGNTDEIFAVAMSKNKDITKKYFLGLMTPPILGWTLGTFFGAVFSNIMPSSITSAFGIAIYAMFLAIVIVPAKDYNPIFLVIGIAVTLSVIFKYVPFINKVSSGFAVVICSVIAASLGAVIFPIREANENEK